MKPVIGVVADIFSGGKHVAHTVHQKYLDAVTAGAGGLALIIPAQIGAPGACWTDDNDFTQLVSMLDGLFLTGAISNVAPREYGAALADPHAPADTARDHVTLKLVRGAVRMGLPVLGVCRGFQEINVALGGTLHQAVHETPGLRDHRERPGASLPDQYAPAHEVAFAPGGLLHAATGMASAHVNSLHGQGVDRLAPNLAVEATAPDGLIEAFRLNDREKFVLGTQWHPEWMFRDDPLSTVIFRTFGEAARAYAKQPRQARLAA